MTTQGFIIYEPKTIRHHGHSITTFVLQAEHPVPVVYWNHDLLLSKGDRVRVTGHASMRVAKNGIQYELTAEHLALI